MNEAAQPPESGEPAGRVRGRKRRFARRWVRRTIVVASAFAAALLVTLFTIDLSHLPWDLRKLAERYGTSYLGRPLHIGRLSAYLTPGDFALDDVVIEGRRPGDRPFFQAHRIVLHVNWYTLLRFSKAQRDVGVEVRLSGWQMLFERWTDGHNLPNLTPKGNSKTSLPFTTTVSVYCVGQGEFDYDDHVTPWSVRAPNLTFALVHAQNLHQYVGRAEFSGGLVQILGYRPMRTDMVTRFALDGKLVRVQHIDLTTEGSKSHVNGVVDFGHWPRQIYNVTSELDFATMREIFFPNETWRVKGDGEFTGAFQLSENWRDLSGEFKSNLATVDDLDFGDLHGSLTWTPQRFEVTHADADLLGGTTRFTYGLAPLGTPLGATATFSADYAGVDLDSLDRLVNLKGLQIVGRANGRIALQWPNGKFKTGRHGDGRMTVVPPPDVVVAAPELPAVALRVAAEPRPFQADRPLGPLAVGGDVFFTLDPDGWTFGDSRVATTHTYVRFRGRMASVGNSAFPFHVTSHDWQESDRVLGAIMTAMNEPTGAIEIGGRGTFDGRMTGTFSSPRIDGHFSGESIRAWDVTWGRTEGDVVIHDRYVDISNSRIGDRSDAFVLASGRYALGFRRDSLDEIDGHVVFTNWPMADLRHAFNLDDWRIDGTVARADLRLTGLYKNMFGSGTLRIDRGVAWKEHFDEATGKLDLEGTGLHVGGIEMTKGPGVVRGDLRIRWDGTYAFHADGTGVLVNSLDNFKIERAPLSGVLNFDAEGEGEFASPKYSFKGSIHDLYAADQGIGDVEGQFNIDGGTMNIQRLVVHSALLVDVEGRGTIALNDHSDADLHLTFTRGDIYPYLKFVMPEGVSPYNSATLSGSLDVSGPLALPHELKVDASIYDARLHLFNYDLTNDGDVQLAFRGDAFRIGRAKLTGVGTNLELTGGADAAKRTWNLSAAGDANLAILQAFPLNISSSGAATIHASLVGPFDKPSVSGNATIVDGRLRPLASAHSLESINGLMTFDDKGINMTGLKGRVGNGQVVFGGNITLRGFNLGEYNLTATGRSMRLRYPQGFNSTVNMDLVLVGPKEAPVLRGRIDVLNAALAAQVDPNAGIFGLAGAAGASGSDLGDDTPAGEGMALGMDIRVVAPRMAFIAQKTQRVEGLGELHIGGTFDRPAITGTVDIVGGEIQSFGNRIFVREGSIRFINPNRIEPVFDVSGETRPRIASQTYVISIRITGSLNQSDRGLGISFQSDPHLSDPQIFSVLFGGTIDVREAEQQALQSPEELRQRMFQMAGATILASALTARVGAVVEKTLPLDTVQITPLLTADTSAASLSLNPTARLTFGKRISDRVYLTYSRTLTTPDQVMLLEYEESDRLSWVLSRNEDRSFALDFRIRHVF